MSDRSCDSCGYEHGSLYVCDSYSKELRSKIEKDGESFRRYVYSEEFPKDCRSQGIPEYVVPIYKIFSE